MFCDAGKKWECSFLFSQTRFTHLRQCAHTSQSIRREQVRQG